jgi:CRISPR-associated protein Cpf1
MDRATLKLNSNPVIIYRPQALEYKVTHKKGSTLVGKRTEDGEQIPRAIYESIYKIKNGFTNVEDADYKKAVDYMKHHKVKTWAATADFSHQKRYMSDKFLLQLTYTKNNDVSDRANDMLNDRVNEAIKDGFNVISVSRSTTDMVYVMALDSDMNILEEKSLNVIDGIDYAAMLSDVYREKLENKKSWVYDTDGKDLKSAYLELAITQILKMAKKYNAVIAVESISDTVKDKYSFLDNQVFRAFEKRIAERLADLSYKDIK